MNVSFCLEKGGKQNLICIYLNIHQPLLEG